MFTGAGSTTDNTLSCEFMDGSSSDEYIAPTIQSTSNSLWINKTLGRNLRCKLEQYGSYLECQNDFLGVCEGQTLTDETFKYILYHCTLTEYQSSINKSVKI